MGISLLTALSIRNNKVKIEVAGPDKNGKYSGWISHFEGNGHYRPDISTEPVYASKQEARKAMQTIINEIKKLKLPRI